MRCYLPTTLTDLAEHHRGGTIPASVERIVAEDESEDAEYAALMAAADASARLVGGVGRRVVMVVEVAEAAGDDPGEVSMSRVEAVHVDLEDGADPDEDLAWFATQEIPGLLGL